MNYLIGISAILLAICEHSVQDEPNTIQNPCFGRVSGFARDLTSCSHYFYCRNGQGFRGICNNMNLFDAEIDYCVQPQNENCFRCPPTGFHTYSVPNACHQFIECFNGVLRLRVCSKGYVYDGRRDKRNCNRPPTTGSCYREQNEPDITPVCPTVEDRPVFLPHPNSCSKYFICTGATVPEQGQCPVGLYINLRSRVCESASTAGCQINEERAPSKPVPTKPPIQPGPAIMCIPDRPATLVPCRVNCRFYYICTRDGRHHQEDCGEHMLFDHRIRKCVPSQEAECWGNTRPPN